MYYVFCTGKWSIDGNRQRVQLGFAVIVIVVEGPSHGPTRFNQEGLVHWTAKIRVKMDCSSCCGAGGDAR